ncbi:MAG: asparagine--tRNA ligase [Bacilli bacterium]
MQIKEIKENYEKLLGKKVNLNGWIKNHRKQKNFGFIDLSDGSSFKNLQIVYDEAIENFDEVQTFKHDSSINIEGIIIKSEGKNQVFEIKAESVNLLGDNTEDYPMQPKRHSMEFLREQAYLRPRTNLFRAVFRIRSTASFLIHEYFQNRNYVYLNAPIITASDAEGAGEMFNVTILDYNNLPKDENGNVDYSKDFFESKANLTVSGQLQAETFATSFGRTYTFGPTFRAENSNTKIHAAEFWMIEPEVAFANLDDILEVEEDVLKYVINGILEKCSDEMKFLDSFVKKGLIKQLKEVANSSFARITHKEAIDILINSGNKFDFKPVQGEDLAKEHERYLTDEYFKKPVFVTDWPKDIKAFYMKVNGDGKTVAAADLLVPFLGELIGGSQREENYDVLKKRMNDMNVDVLELEWYLNLRKYGTCVHSGFGIGFERLLIYLTGIENIRDVIAFPRTPGSCEF